MTASGWIRMEEPNLPGLYSWRNDVPGAIPRAWLDKLIRGISAGLA